MLSLALFIFMNIWSANLKGKFKSFNLMGDEYLNATFAEFLDGRGIIHYFHVIKLMNKMILMNEK